MTSRPKYNQYLTSNTRQVPAGKRVKRTILLLWDLHYLANALVKIYFPKTEIATFTRAVNIVQCQFLRVDNLKERPNRSFRA